MSDTIIPNVQKIAVLRANAIGDFIVTLPALTAIRKAYPTAEIILLGKEWHKEYLTEGRSPINRVIVIPITKGIRIEENQVQDDQQVHRFFQEFQKEHIDVAVHFHGDGKSSNQFINQLGAKVTVGLTAPGAASIDRAIPFYYYQSEVIRYLEVASCIGAHTIQLEPQLQILSQDLLEAQSFLESEKITEDYIVIHPCGTDIRRNWPIEKFAELITLLATRGYSIICTGSKLDHSVLEKLANATKVPIINAAGKLSLSGLTGLLSKAKCLISSDTGPLHIARAINTKTVGIYWAPNLLNWGPLTRANHYPVISWELHCKYCGIIPNTPYPFQPTSEKCEHLYSFVENISSQEVITAVDNIL